jgi:amidophosphoribosyltransferase
MCGIVGMLGQESINVNIFDALSVLQHRGQDAAGIATSLGGRVFMTKGKGLAKDVFDHDKMSQLIGKMGIGQVRYPTAGSENSTEAQPFYVNSPFGIVLAHNGNLTNAETLKQELSDSDRRHINTYSDTEVLLNIFAFELSLTAGKEPTPDDVFSAIAKVHQRCKGGYAVVLLIPSFGMVAFRDPYGIRPLIYGSKEQDSGTDYMVCSESVALDVLGFNVEDDVKAGEAIVFLENGVVHKKQCSMHPLLSPCLFEFVYLARPDSIIDGVSVYKSRLRMGKKLAAKIAIYKEALEIDVIIPIPDTSRSAAIQVSTELGIKYREGFIKNRYIGRTFIMPGQKIRKKSVRQKLNAIKLEFRGKNVLLIDDSIVRGTTCSQIIEMARHAGARKVYFASAAPVVRFPNVYGIDMPVAQELIAHNRTVQDIQEEIGADWLVYLDLEDLRASVQEGNPEITSYEDSVFTGNYITGDLDNTYFDRLESKRSDTIKENKRSL